MSSQEVLLSITRYDREGWYVIRVVVRAVTRACDPICVRYYYFCVPRLLRSTYYVAHFLRPTDLEELLAHLFRLSSHLLDLLLLGSQALVLVRG